jgi:hypothetical protein
MHDERSPSLLLPKLTAILLVIVFLSGMSEIIFLAKYARQNTYTTANVTSKLNNKTTNANTSVEDVDATEARIN